MKWELTKCQLAERSISKKYRKEIWNPFIAAVKRYELIAPGGQNRGLRVGRQGFLSLRGADADAAAVRRSAV